MHKIISLSLSGLVTALVIYGAAVKELPLQSGGPMLLAVLAYWAEPPKSPAGNGETGGEGE